MLYFIFFTNNSPLLRTVIGTGKDKGKRNTRSKTTRKRKEKKLEESKDQKDKEKEEIREKKMSVLCFAHLIIFNIGFITVSFII